MWAIYFYGPRNRLARGSSSRADPAHGRARTLTTSESFVAPELTAKTAITLRPRHASWQTTAHTHNVCLYRTFCVVEATPTLCPNVAEAVVRSVSEDPLSSHAGSEATRFTTFSNSLDFPNFGPTRCSSASHARSLPQLLVCIHSHASCDVALQCRLTNAADFSLKPVSKAS